MTVGLWFPYNYFPSFLELAHLRFFEFPQNKSDRYRKSGTYLAQYIREERGRFGSRERIRYFDFRLQGGLCFFVQPWQRRTAAREDDARYILIVSLPVAQ